jgi:signal transduction histidine kinase
VEVRLAVEQGGLLLDVHDDGKGISKDKLGDSKSLGILGMRERAMLLGGEFAIESFPGNGTTVRVRIPGSYPTEGEQVHG